MNKGIMNLKNLKDYIVIFRKRRIFSMNNELAKTKIDERTGIEYILDGDYYVPNIVMVIELKLNQLKI